MSDINTIVIGSGRFGTNIARSLSNQGNGVLLIDRNRKKIEAVFDFSGFVEVGDGTDQTFLEANGIMDAKRVVAITDDDNTNIFIADLCEDIYGIPEIYIRLKDSRKAKIVSSQVKCICPFDLTLDDFGQQFKGELK